MLMEQKPMIIGAVHLPLYGAWDPRRSIGEIEEYVLANCGVFYNNGIRALYIQDENPETGPAAPETIALLSSLGRLLKKEYPELELGIVVEAHDPKASMAIATACGASFVRIKVFVGAMYKNAGILQGCGIETAKYRVALGSGVKIFADIHDRCGYPMQPQVPVELDAQWAVRAGADALILTGMTYRQSLEYLDVCRNSGIRVPMVMGGSVTAENIREVLDHCQGAVVSSSLMLDAVPQGSLIRWDGKKIRRFMDIAEGKAVE